ncbi:MAG: hypothetical protein R3E86_08970 [Pseudomonadales bacterium]
MGGLGRVRGMVARGAAVVVVGLLSGGCASMDRDEATWLALHSMDVAQTLNAASDPCYEETAWLTSRLIGNQPSDAEVLAWGVGTAVAHAWIGRVLEEQGAPRWVQKAWDVTTISYTTYTISQNHADGVRPFGDNQPVDGCYRS